MSRDELRAMWTAQNWRAAIAPGLAREIVGG